MRKEPCGESAMWGRRVAVSGPPVELVGEGSDPELAGLDSSKDLVVDMFSHCECG